MAKLFYVDDNGEKAFITINAENPHVLIGRGKECDIKTKNSSVSRNHCQVIYSGGQFKLFDLGSLNGTYYKKQKVKEQILDDCEVFFCGNFDIKFELEEHERIPPAPEIDLSAEEIIEVLSSEEEKLEIPAGELIRRETVVSVDAKQEKPRFFETASYDEAVSQVQKEMLPQTAHKKPVREEEAKEFELSVLERRELEDRISECENLIFLKDREIEQMQNSLADKEKQIQSLTEAYTESQRKIAEVTLASAGAADELNRLRGAYEWLKNEFGEKEKEFKEALDKKERDLKEQRVVLLNEQSLVVTTLRNELERQEKRATELSQQIEALRTQRDALLEENKRWEELKKEFEREKQAELEDRKKLEVMLSSQEEKIRSLKEAEFRLEKAAAENAALKKENEELRSANKMYIKKVSKLIEEKEAAEKESEKMALETEKNALQSDNVKLQNLLNVALDEKKELLSKIDRLTEKLALLEKEKTTALTPPEAAPAADYDSLLDKLNEIISTFKTNIDVLENYILEVSAKLPEDRENVLMIEMIQDTFKELKAASQDFKSELKSHRRS